MARDRKRAKQRQRRAAERQPAHAAARRQQAPASQPLEDTVATPEPLEDSIAAPDPLEDASAGVEIAEAAMVDPPVASLRDDEQPQPYEEAGESPAAEAAARAPRDDRRAAAPGADLPKEGNRFANFLRACVAELGRVQWPDRRQVTQATGVVIGFVIIAGAYLGVLDAIFSRLVSAIL